MRYWDSTFHNAIGSTKHNWLVLKNIFRYLQGIKHLILIFQFPRNLDTNIIGYIDQIPTMSDRRQAQCSYQVWQPSHEESSKQTSWLHSPTIISNRLRNKQYHYIAYLASQIMQLICSSGLYQLLCSRNVFMELVCDGFEFCKNQGEYLPELFLFNASYYTLFPFMSLLYRFS